MSGIRTFPIPRLAAWRRFLGLSQPELARRADVDISVIAAVEQGRHDVQAPSLARLAVAIGVSRTMLMHETPEEAWARGWRPPEHEAVMSATQERTAASA